MSKMMIQITLNAPDKFLAQLYEPYADNPETRGFMRVSPEILNEYIPKFMADGWQVVRLICLFSSHLRRP